jgi:hypothetical protein
MIYRILIDTVAHEFDDATQTAHEYPSGTNLRGAFTAGLSEGLDDIPYPHITNPRARFYFTEAGWQKYGRPMYAAALQRGHTIRVVRRKNPAKSQIVYQDAYQVAILPTSAKHSGTGTSHSDK